MRPQPSCRLPSIPSSPPTRDKPGGRCAARGTIVTIALALALGVAIGALLGLLGGGGSILAVPALGYALGWGVELAIPISLIVIGVASAAGAVPKVRAGQVQWRLAGSFAAVGIPATLAGAAIGRHLSQPAIMLGFAVVMVIAGGRMPSDSANTGTACKGRR